MSRLDDELVSALNEYVALTEEYQSKFVSITPLGSGPVPVLPYEALKDLTEKVQSAEQRYHALRKQLWGY